MKESKRVLLVIFIALLLLFVLGKLTMGLMIRKIQNIPVSSPKLSTLQDGNYIGEYSIEPVYAKVEVSIEHHHISRIELLQHDHGLGSEAESILQDVVKEQSLDIDAVSGATVSSKCILKAIENALEQ